MIDDQRCVFEDIVKASQKCQKDGKKRTVIVEGGPGTGKYSFLDSVKKVFPDAPVINLQEHYRCNPKIIGFCNQKFYDGNLFVMTEDNNDSPLSAIKTSPGNHARGKFNQRQIDVIVNEVLPKLDYAASDIGIIAPYNDQVFRHAFVILTKKAKCPTRPGSLDI